MFDTTLLKIAQAIKNFTQIPLTSEEIAAYRNTFVYPAGMIPYYSMQLNYKFNERTNQEVLNYFNQIVNQLFSDVYTATEKEVIKYYCLLQAKHTLLLQPSSAPELARMESLIQTQTDKEEIKYIIQDMAYAILHFYLLESSETTNTTLINNLMDELSAVEEQHNHFNLFVRQS